MLELEMPGPLWALCPFVLALSVSACGAPGASDAGIDAQYPELATEDRVVADRDATGDVSDAGSTGDVALPEYMPQSVPGRHNLTVGATRQIVPGPGLPPETPAMNSNNNLDLVRHDDGRLYLAWRSAPDHYASPMAVIHVVSTADEQTWRYEASYAASSDLREPRLLSLNGSLFLYLARLGTNPNAFEPQGMSYAEKPSGGTWTPLTDFYTPDTIAWRARRERGTAYLTVYRGGEHIYDFSGLPMDVELLTSADGRTWAGLNPGNPVVSHGGGSETDFTLGDDGSLFAVIRNEAGDETGFGSKVCRAPANALTTWTCRHDPKKYDSPLMFWYDGEAYLIGRRNVTPSGAYDLEQRSLELLSQLASYQIDYVARRKRCAVWRYDQTTDAIVFLQDLPSRGDTCFPALVPGSQPGEFIVYNYSSPIDGPDVIWRVGQQGPTNVYRTVLQFSRRNP